MVPFLLERKQQQNKIEGCARACLSAARENKENESNNEVYRAAKLEVLCEKLQFEPRGSLTQLQLVLQ